MFILVCITVCKLILECNVCKGEAALDNVTTVPTNCSAGTFYSRDYLKCIPCSWCDSYSTKLSSCTATEDTVCIRCTDTSNPEIYNHPLCKKCPPCKSGEYMDSPCTNDSLTVCRPCPSESFNTLASYKTHCFPCASCENRIMIKDCNASMDTVCGRCKRGYYNDPSRNDCYRCSSCGPGEKVMEDCKGGRPGKLCSAFQFYRVDYVQVPNDLQKDTTESISLVQTSSLYANATYSASTPPVSSTKPGSHTEILITSACLLVLIICIIALIFYFRRRRQRGNGDRLLNDKDGDEFYLEEDFNDKSKNNYCSYVVETRLPNSFGDISSHQTSLDFEESCCDKHDAGCSAIHDSNRSNDINSAAVKGQPKHFCSKTVNKNHSHWFKIPGRMYSYGVP